MKSPSAYCQLLFANCLLLIDLCLLPIAFCQLFIIKCKLLFANFFLIIDLCYLPIALCLLLIENCFSWYNLSFASMSVENLYREIPRTLSCYLWKNSCAFQRFDTQMKWAKATRGPKGHCRSPGNNESIKNWLRNGTKNNNTSSHMLLDHCYTFGLLLWTSSLKRHFLEEAPSPRHLFLSCHGSALG